MNESAATGPTGDVRAVLDATSVHPTPSDEELAAIVAAIETVWPRPDTAGTTGLEVPRWRFSGRWWTKPLPVRRERP